MLQKMNYSLFHSINKFAGYNTCIDTTAKLIAEYLPFIFIPVMMYYWFFKKDDASKTGILLVGYSTLLALLINLLITLFYFYPRPFMMHLGRQLVAHAPETSFPSDHTTFMFSIAFAFIAFNVSGKTGIILALLALIGGLTRVFAGVHFPFDVAGSIVVSLISTAIVFVLKEFFSPINKRLIVFYRNILSQVSLKQGK